MNKKQIESLREDVKKFYPDSNSFWLAKTINDLCDELLKSKENQEKITLEFRDLAEDYMIDGNKERSKGILEVISSIRKEAGLTKIT